MSTETGSGIDAMRARIERGRRQPPRPRRPQPEAPTEASGDVAAEVPAPAAPSAKVPAQGDAKTSRPRPRAATARAQERLSPSLPSANLAIRVRRPLDDRLADVIHELRREGVRTSKVELIEMLLWEFDTSDLDALRKRISRFRRVAPRAAGADTEA